MDLNANDLCIRKIVVACSSGLVSSAMGARLLKEVLNTADIEVTNTAISKVDTNADLLIVQKEYRRDVELLNLNIPVMYVDNYLDKDAYKQIRCDISD